MKNLLLIIILLWTCSEASANKKLSPSEIIKKSEDNFRGNSQEGRLSMKIINSNGERNIRFDFWSKNRIKTLIKILEPVKEVGSGNLRIELNLWRYLSNVDRVIKVPPSMMLQSWMGSDFSYDDLVQTSSLFTDYTHNVIKEDKDQVVIECIPKPTAPVVWGKIVETILWKGFVTIKRDFVNEKGDAVKSMTGEDIRNINGHTIPHLLTMVNLKKKDSKTILKYEKLKFDTVTSDDFFTQKKLKER